MLEHDTLEHRIGHGICRPRKFLLVCFHSCSQALFRKPIKQGLWEKRKPACQKANSLSHNFSQAASPPASQPTQQHPERVSRQGLSKNVAVHSVIKSLQRIVLLEHFQSILRESCLSPSRENDLSPQREPQPIRQPALFPSHPGSQAANQPASPATPRSVFPGWEFL